MKTPDRINLYYSPNKLRYDPRDSEYEQIGDNYITVPCLINKVSKAQILKEYGTYNQQIIKVRFNRNIKPFLYAEFEGQRYERADGVDAPIKGSVTLRRIQI